jgi:hypothetical protein
MESAASCPSAASPEVPVTSEVALRLAIKLAVDAGEYERAALILDVLRPPSSRGEALPTTSSAPGSP